MHEMFCLVCAEVRIIIPIGPDGSCPYCGGSSRDCECDEICHECENDLKIMEEE